MMQKVRTTVSLPTRLLARVDALVRGGMVASRNEFLTVAIHRELERRRREAIDREFEGMADDPVYRQEALDIAAEYGTADWEALRVAETDT